MTERLVEVGVVECHKDVVVEDAAPVDLACNKVVDHKVVSR